MGPTEMAPVGLGPRVFQTFHLHSAVTEHVYYEYILNILMWTICVIYPFITVYLEYSYLLYIRGCGTVLLYCNII